jgi:hypothetical protein
MQGHVFYAGAIILLERTTQVLNKRASPNWTIPEGCSWYDVTEPLSSRSRFPSVISRWCCVCLLYAKYTYEEDGKDGEDGDEECDTPGAYNHHQVPYSTLSTLLCQRLTCLFQKGLSGWYLSEGLLSRSVLKQLKTPSASVMDSAKTLYTTCKHRQI